MWLRLVKLLPWRTIIATTPKIVDAARTLYEARRRAAPPPEFRGSARDDSTRDLEYALATLEEYATRQAAVVAQLAAQVEAMTGAIEIMRRRLALALAASLVASGLALLFALVAFFRT
ncbi:MAG: hypothetical protein HYR51_00965 [Candidatus Rokubacteria bacterium]|nr:hypothetical protein [Candidatus Rokubacteria bacterium]